MKAKAVLCVAVLGAAIVAGCSKAKERPGEIPAVAWGEAVNGVRYGLSCDKRSFESGKPVRFTAHVENVGETTVTIFDPTEPSYSFRWRLTFTPSAGGMPFIAQDHAHVRREFRETRLAPGETKTGRIEIDSALLPETLHIQRGRNGEFVRELPPGRYRAVAEEPGGKFTTGAVEIEIAAKGGAAAE